MSRRRADYVYRNADDSKRVRILRRESGRWVFDVFDRDGEIETSSDHAEDYARKVDAKRRATEVVGSLASIQVENVRDGWDDPQIGATTIVTAETITDDQIRSLVRDTDIDFDTALRAAWRERLVGESKVAYQRSRMAARARCAKVWNAVHVRRGEPPAPQQARDRRAR